MSGGGVIAGQQRITGSMKPYSFSDEVGDLLLTGGAALLLSLIVLPPQLALMLHGDGSVLWVLQVLGGVTGMTALYFVIRKIINPTAHAPQSGVLRATIGAGVLTLSILLVYSFRSGFSTDATHQKMDLTLIASAAANPKKGD